MFAAVLLFAGGCNDFITYQVWDGAPKIAPEEVSVEARRKVTFTVEGGRPPYLFEVAAGGGEIAADGEQAVYTAPSAVGSALVRVTDNLGGRAEARVTVVAPPPPLKIAPAKVDVWLGGRAQFRASGGEPPYRFSVLSGGGSIGAGSGAYKAPVRVTTAVIQVTDRRGDTRQATVVVHFWPW